ncbi:MAG: transposase, partial [Acidimicrobiales bacterium]
MEHQRQYVGIDLHRRCSVIVRINDAGEVLETVRVVNDPLKLALAMAEAGDDPEVALEATYGWYWAADLLQAEGAHVHLVHPLGLHWDSRRVKNDVLDATELARRLSRGDLPEAWIAPPELRELRELVRYRQARRPAHLGQGPGAAPRVCHQEEGTGGTRYRAGPGPHEQLRRSSETDRQG